MWTKRRGPEEQQKRLYLSFSKEDIGDDVREATTQHQHHTLLAVCYTRHLKTRGALHCVCCHKCTVCMSSVCVCVCADLCSKAAVRAHSAEGQQGLLEGWG